MFPDRAVGEELDAFGDDLTERGKVKRVENLGAGRDFPAEKKTDNPNNAQPVKEDLLDAPDPLGRSGRLPAVERNKMQRRIFFL
jgi:hypothetical protein